MKLRLSIEEVDCRRADLEGDESRELGLLCGRSREPKGESDLGVMGAVGSKLCDIDAGDLEREAGRTNGSDLLRPRELGSPVTCQSN
jgi:hypothetical protein